MPVSYLANSHAKRFPNVLAPRPADAPTRASLGLPEEPNMVFCAFNHLQKVTPATWDAWMDIVEQTPGSVLWMLEFETGGTPNLVRYAEQRLGSAERLVITPLFDRDVEYIGKSLCDLHLDTWFFSAHSTSIDVLWSGVPSLTFAASPSFASRVGSSLVRRLGYVPRRHVARLPELTFALPLLQTDNAGPGDVVASRVRRARRAARQRPRFAEAHPQRRRGKPNGKGTSVSTRFVHLPH